MKYYAIRKGHHPRIICGEWAQVEEEIKREIRGFSCPEWKGFPTRVQAEAYMAAGSPAMDRVQTVPAGQPIPRPKKIPAVGQSGEDALAAGFTFTADAVIFVDGSRNFDAVDFDSSQVNRRRNKKYPFYFGAYGILIFFRDGTVYVENARVEDGAFTDPDAAYFTTTHHGFTVDADGSCSPVKDFTEQTPYRQWQSGRTPVGFQDRYVLASWNVVGELEGARHALDLCFYEKKLNSAYVFYDCDQVNLVDKIACGKKPQLQSNVTRKYGDFCQQLIADHKHVSTMHVYSHSKGQTLGIPYDWRHELFNSCADVLAKAETYNKPIDGVKENKPLRPYGLVPFQDEVVYRDDLSEDEIGQTIDARRKYAFALIQAVLADPKTRPEFI